METMIWTCHQVSGRPLLNLQNLCAGSPLSSASVVVLNSSEYEAALRPTSVLSKSLPSPGVTLSCSGRLPFVARVASSATLASHGHLLPLVKSQYAVRSSWRMSIGEVKPVASTPFHLATKVRAFRPYNACPGYAKMWKCYSPPVLLHVMFLNPAFSFACTAVPGNPQGQLCETCSRC